MALLKVSYCLLDDNFFFDILCDAFDEIKEVQDEPFDKVKTFRVQHEEITKEDKIICPEFIEFRGIKPFIISFE